MPILLGIMLSVDSDGILMDYRSSTRLTNLSVSRANKMSWISVSINTMPLVEVSSCDMLENGKTPSSEWDDGLISKLVTRPYNLLLWSQFGGSLDNCGKRIRSIGDSRSCLTLWDVLRH